MDYHILLGIAASVIGTLAYVPYFRDIFRGTTKPHPFTWFVFGLLNGIVFFGQFVANAGPGAWVTGITSVACLSIGVLGFIVGEKYITPIDYVCFAGALFGVALWVLTKEPLAAIVVVTITDGVAFIPTIRKSYREPDTETLSTYIFGTVKYVLGVFAVASFNLTTVLFPASISVINLCFAAMVIIRRRQLRSV